MATKKPTLGQLFVGALAAIFVVVGVSFVLFLRRAERSTNAAAQSGREQIAKRVHSAVTDELARATRALEHVERGILTGAITPTDEESLEADLFLEALGDDHLAEVTFTRATVEGYDAEGDARLAAAGRSQVSLLRLPDGRLVTRITRADADGGSFRSFQRVRPRNGGLRDTPLEAAGAAADPAAHLTFVSPIAQVNQDRAIWSDLHFAEPDASLPMSERRVVLTVQKAIANPAGAIVGVARVGLLTTELDALARTKPFLSDPNDPHVVALLSLSSGAHSHADLVARVDPEDRTVLVGEDVRITAAHPPAPLATLLASPILQGLDFEHPNRDATLDVGGERYLVTLREIAAAPGGTSGWFVAVLGPEAYYTREVRALQRSFAVAFALTLALVVAIGFFTMRAVRRGLAQVVGETERMQTFDFRARNVASGIRDVEEVISGIERAKTVVRAMGKYIPIELVRRLYATNEEPALGGTLAEISLMFTDIEGFTTLSEKLSPDELAKRLGDYLAAMTSAIEACDGTIDKYIGDAVMAMWNAPRSVEGHSGAACRAALEAMKAVSALYQSKAWAGLPPLVTRFGLHKAKVMVGHFGAPTRFSYTALGDGVNLAARLEPLCKQYGVLALASEDIVADAKSEFVFRRIDRVAVKGKTKGIDVYELLGRVGDEIPKKAAAQIYEKAFEAYLARDFVRAKALLEPQIASDPPSAILFERCIDLASHPPPAEWDGVHVAKSK